MSNERTPGRWKWFNDGDLANEDGYMVLRPDSNRGIPTDADAALIAAAPELYDALLAIHATVNCELGAICRACNALRKAKVSS